MSLENDKVISTSNHTTESLCTEDDLLIEKYEVGGLLHYNRDGDSKLYILKSIKISNTGNQVLYWIKTKDGKQFDTTKDFIQSLAEKIFQLFQFQ